MILTMKMIKLERFPEKGYTAVHDHCDKIPKDYISMNTCHTIITVQSGEIKVMKLRLK